MSNDSVNPLTEGYFRWRCRRGMKELDFILNRFIDAKYNALHESELIVFDELLSEEDTLLWYWLSGKTKPDTHSKFKKMVEQICAAGYHKK